MKFREAVGFTFLIFSLSCTSGVFERRSIYTAEKFGAYCNDKKAAVYYLDDKGSSNGWLVHFEGGGGCYSFKECNERWQKFRILMSSSEYPNSICGSDILSSNLPENEAFANFSQVLVPYCSSDGWLGSRELANTAFSFTNAPDADNFAFRGHMIFQAVINDLISLHNLSNSSELVLVGTSAGGVGVLNHLPWVRAQLPRAQIKAIVDSAWFIEFGGKTVSSWSQSGSGAFTDLAACADTTFGYPCCVSPNCLYQRRYLTDALNIPIFLISSLYDIYILRDTLNTLLSDEAFTINDLLRTFNTYGALMNASILQTAAANKNVSVYAPSCTQHVYLATSSLWNPSDGLLNTTESGTYQEGKFWLTNYIRNGTWNAAYITTNGTVITLYEAIVKWYKSGGQQALYLDNCTGPVCSGTCPSNVGVTPIKHLWSSPVNISVLAFLGSEILMCLLIKMAMYLMAKYLLLKQRNFLQRRKIHFPRPQHKIGISCFNLTYQVEVVNKPNLVGEGQHKLSSLCCHCCCQLSRSKVIPVNPKGATPDSGHHSTNCSYADTPQQNSSSSGKKAILSDVNFYVNPGELAAIMGPSGCGKTTLLDVLLGKRSSGNINGEVFVNGVGLESVKNWFILNSGYVRQLAVSFYSELTVRQNLLLAMTMQSQKEQSTSQILERVEQVIQETGLLETADLKVGNESGLGISGGQKRKLAIAVQLLSMPSILFLDEPTSGLDSASSFEVLCTLRQLVDSGRTVIVTIHQPRSKVFHMFDKILFLSEGKVAFFGSPLRVFEFINNSLRQQVTLNTDINPADALLDLLKKEDLQKQLVASYLNSGDPTSIKQAVKVAKTSFAVEELTTYKRNPGLWQRIMSLEARASLRQSKFSVVYLPILYPLFGVVLGTTYLATPSAVQILSVTCVLSCSSALFMSGIVMNLLLEPLKIFHLEYSDGISYSYDIILQVFFRMTAVSFLPLTACFVIVTALVYDSFDFISFVSILLTFLVDNQVWVALFIVIGVLFPPGAARICAVMSAIGGFFCGFIVPVSSMPCYYKWIISINPSYYAYSATGSILLNNREQLNCGRESKLECFSYSGSALLSSFGLDNVNPFENLLIMVAMTVILVIMAVIILMFRMRYGVGHLYFRVAQLWRLCSRCGTRASPGTSSQLEDIQPAIQVLCPACFLANNDVHVVFNGGEEETVPDMRRYNRLASDAFVPQVSEATTKSDVVIVEDEEERLRITAQRIRERRERMNNEIRRLKHFNNIIRKEDYLGTPGKRHSQPCDVGYLGRSMCQPLPPQVSVVHRSVSLPLDKTSEAPRSHMQPRDLEASGCGLQPLPEKDLPVLDEGSEDLESLDLNSIPENEVNLSDYDN